MKIHVVSPTRYFSLYWEFIIAALRALFIGPTTYGGKLWSEALTHAAIETWDLEPLDTLKASLIRDN